jgi:hypothetical protein
MFADPELDFHPGREPAIDVESLPPKRNFLSERAPFSSLAPWGVRAHASLPTGYGMVAGAPG